MSIYECTMVYNEREPNPDVRYTNVEKHTMDVEQMNSRLDGQRKPNSEVKVYEDTIDDHGLDQSIKRQKLSSRNESSNSKTYNDQNLPMTL